MEKSETLLTTGCPNLDLLLRGGLPRKGITQIYGESGIGKTQLALQLCLSAQISMQNLKTGTGMHVYFQGPKKYKYKHLNTFLCFKLVQTNSKHFQFYNWCKITPKMYKFITNFMLNSNCYRANFYRFWLEITNFYVLLAAAN